MSEDCWKTADSQLQANTEGNELPAYDEIERFIFALPVLSRTLDDDDVFPHSSSNGYMWHFVLQDRDDPMIAQYITHDMMREWQVSPKKLMQTARGNAQTFQNEAVYAMLYCKTETATIPYLKLYYKNNVECECAPFGSSLILLPDVMNRVHVMIGDFCTYIDDIDQVYVVQTAILEQANLNPWETFQTISRKDKDEEPFFFQAGLLFPKKGKSSGSGITTF